MGLGFKKKIVLYSFREVKYHQGNTPRGKLCCIALEKWNFTRVILQVILSVTLCYYLYNNLKDSLKWVTLVQWFHLKICISEVRVPFLPGNNIYLLVNFDSDIVNVMLKGDGVRQKVLTRSAWLKSHVFVSGFIQGLRTLVESKILFFCCWC